LGAASRSLISLESPVHLFGQLFDHTTLSVRGVHYKLRCENAHTKLAYY
jgi:hypothetical protein